MTGILSGDRKEWITSIGHVFQSWRGARFLYTFKDEWNKYREKGKIRDDYEKTEQFNSCFGEILDFLDKEIPDNMRFNILKQIMLVAGTEEASSRDSYLPQQYLQIARSLSSGEILVFTSAYDLAKKQNIEKITAAGRWLALVAENSGLQFPVLVEIQENKLINKGLLMGRHFSDRSGVELGNHFRLTDLGWSLAEYISHYEDPSLFPH